MIKQNVWTIGDGFKLVANKLLHKEYKNDPMKQYKFKKKPSPLRNCDQNITDDELDFPFFGDLYKF